MTNSLDKVLISILQGIDKSVGLGLEQAQVTIDQFLKWEFYSNIFIALVFLFLIPICFYIKKKVCVRVDTNKFLQPWEKETRKPVIFVVTLICVFIFSLVSYICFFNAVKVKIAPNVYLLEHAIKSRLIP